MKPPKILRAKMSVLSLSFLIGAASLAHATESIDARIQYYLDHMTIQQKLDYIHGVTPAPGLPNSTGASIAAIPSLGLPEIRNTDGPNGVRSDVPSTLYPAALLLAASWDPQLAWAKGIGVGQDARARGFHIWLGPGMDVYRVPVGGRNSEYLCGEDPYLGSQMLIPLIEAVQKEGVVATSKHFAANDQEYNRYSINTIVDERKEAITVQSLLDMTSGIEWTERLGDSSAAAVETESEMDSSPDWVKFILDRPMSTAPGDIFNYNSGNPHLLSAILTKLTGMSALEYAKSKLFGPLGITKVSWQHDPQGISNGGWGLDLVPRDMAKIGYLYLRKGVWEGQELLPPAWIDKVSHATVNMRLGGLRYSNLFWALPDKRVYMAVGRNGQVIMVSPDLDVVAVTTGRENYRLSEVADSISRSVKSDTSLPADAESAQLLANKILDVSTGKPH
jgi:hypothetical protein